MSRQAAPSQAATVPSRRRPSVPAVGRAARGVLANLPFVALAVLVLVAIAWPLLVPFDPLDTRAGRPLQPPSSAHWFGTDQSGRDVFSRVLAGTRISLLVGGLSALLATALGALLGTICAMAKTWIAEPIMRCLDVMLAFPAILLAVVLAATLGTGESTTVIVLAAVYTPAIARFVRALVLGELEEDYVLSARLLGTRKIRLVGYHVGANMAIPLLVYTAAIAAEAIIAEAALSYIGLGIPPPAPSWGNIINDGKGLLYSGQWWVSGFGGLAVFVAVFTLNGAANALNRRLDAGVERG